MPKQSLMDRIAERKEQFMDDLSTKVAELQRPLPDQEHVKPEERQRRFWQVDKAWPKDPEEARIKELALQGFNPDGTPLLDAQGNPVQGISAQDVGLLKYPMREIDAKVFGGYDDDMGQYQYMLKMSELGPPEPEPLEAEARAIEERRRAEQQAKAEPPMPSMSEVFNQMPIEPQAPAPGAEMGGL